MFYISPGGGQSQLILYDVKNCTRIHCTEDIRKLVNSPRNLTMLTLRQLNVSRNGYFSARTPPRYVVCMFYPPRAPKARAKKILRIWNIFASFTLSYLSNKFISLSKNTELLCSRRIDLIEAIMLIISKKNLQVCIAYTGEHHTWF